MGTEPQTWHIHPDTPGTWLDENNTTQVRFLVNHDSQAVERAIFEVLGGDRTHPSWFTVDPPEQDVPPGQRMNFTVSIRPPQGTPARWYDFRGRVRSAGAGAFASHPQSAISSPIDLDGTRLTGWVNWSIRVLGDTWLVVPDGQDRTTFAVTYHGSADGVILEDGRVAIDVLPGDGADASWFYLPQGSGLVVPTGSSRRLEVRVLDSAGGADYGRFRVRITDISGNYEVSQRITVSLR